MVWVEVPKCQPTPVQFRGERSQAAGTTRVTPSAIALRVVVLLAIVVLATWAAHLLKDALNLTIMPGNEQRVHRILMVGLVAYIGLLAIPFVPGAEIGIAMLTAFGAAIAPLVYVATVCAMMLCLYAGAYSSSHNACRDPRASAAAQGRRSGEPVLHAGAR
jgi:hypothetical protein